MISPNDFPGGGPEQDPAPDTRLDTSNQFAVGVRGNGIVVMVRIPDMPLTKAQAINLAAWLLVLADPNGREFTRVVEGIKNT